MSLPVTRADIAMCTDQLNALLVAMDAAIDELDPVDLKTLLSLALDLVVKQADWFTEQETRHV